MMHQRTLWACACGAAAALALSAAVASADWQTIDTFEGMAIDSEIDMQNGWSSPFGFSTLDNHDVTRKVVADPSGADNRAVNVFSMWGNNFDDGHKAAALPEGTTGTMYFRFYVPAWIGVSSSGPDIGVGMVDQLNPPSGSPTLAGPMLRIDGDPVAGAERTLLQVNPLNAGWITVGTVAEDTWYGAWLVIDNSTDKFQVYLQGGAFADPTLLQDDFQFTTFDFRTPSANDLVNVWFRPNNSHRSDTTLLDDFYFDPTGQNLTVPEPAPTTMPDLNMDGKVDIFDVAIVSNNWANSGTPGTVTGDANKDGVVDIFDVALISNNWNPGGGAAAVPEPNAAALVCLGVGAAGVFGRRRS